MFGIREWTGNYFFSFSLQLVALYFCTTLNCTCFGNNANQMAKKEKKKKLEHLFRIHSILRKNGFRLDEIVAFARHHTLNSQYSQLWSMNKPILQLDAMRLWLIIYRWHLILLRKHLREQLVHCLRLAAHSFAQTEQFKANRFLVLDKLQFILHSAKPKDPDAWNFYCALNRCRLMFFFWFFFICVCAHAIRPDISIVFFFFRYLSLGVLKFLNMNPCKLLVEHQTRMHKVTRCQCQWRSNFYCVQQSHSKYNWHFGQCVNPLITSTARHKQTVDFV